MKRLILLSAVAAIAATPALAKSNHHKTRHHQAARQVVVPGAAYGSMARDPYAVYVNGHYAGRDPDPNVRQSLVNEYYWLHRPFY